MEQLKKYFQRDRFAAEIGVELVSVAPGEAVARLRLEERHQNALGTAQGGAVFTLADLAFAAACHTRGFVAVAVNVSITYLKAARSGVLTAAAREVSVNPKLGSYTVTVTDERQEVVALFQGLAYRKKEPLPL